MGACFRGQTIASQNGKDIQIEGGAPALSWAGGPGTHEIVILITAGNLGSPENPSSNLTWSPVAQEVFA